MKMKFDFLNRIKVQKNYILFFLYRFSSQSLRLAVT